MTNKIEYYVVENDAKKMTQLMVRDASKTKSVLVAFWNWRLTGKQGAWQAATRLRDSRQRMADSGKPIQVEAQLLSGPIGKGEKLLAVEVYEQEQYAMKLEGK